MFWVTVNISPERNQGVIGLGLGPTIDIRYVAVER